MALAARLLSGAVIAPGQTVSVIGLAGPFTKERGYGDGPGYAGGQLVPVTAGGVCKIGTAMYNVAVHGGLTVVERHPHSLPVPYIRPGRDAAIAAGYKDVRVRNHYDRPVLLWAGMKETTLFVALYGDVEAPHGTSAPRRTRPGAHAAGTPGESGAAAGPGTDRVRRLRRCNGAHVDHPRAPGPTRRDETVER